VKIGVFLAWRQLVKDKKRLAAAISGVAFAVILMLVQWGFEQALFTSVGLLYSHFSADLVLISPKYQHANSPGMFTVRRLYQALALEEVEWICPVYVGSVIWNNPANPAERAIYQIAFDPQRNVFDLPEVSDGLGELRRADVLLFDAQSRSEFGPVTVPPGGVRTAVGLSGFRVEVAGIFHLGTSFAVDGNIITSDLTFQHVHPDRDLALANLGLVKLKPGVAADAARVRLKTALPGDVLVLTREQLRSREIRYWAGNTPIGFVFGLGVLMGLIVGSVVVYQILYSDVADHLDQYAILKALGYTEGVLFRLVVQEALILSVLGFIPGAIISNYVYGIAHRATLLPLDMEPVQLGAVYLLTAAMCALSGAFAMRKVRAAEPAEIF
jgi:putative ABC transport system permease protein